MKEQQKLLIVDDDPNILEVLDARFSAAGFTVLKADDAESALTFLKSDDVDLVISDIKMPNMSGIQLFTKIQTTAPGLPVIFLTAYGSIKEAVSAVQSGAVDYLTKPFDGKALVEKVKIHLDRQQQPLTGKEPPKNENTGFIWGESPPMKLLHEMMLRVAASDVNTLILGESGSGKEGIAKAIHDNSHRRKGPYIIVDCGSTPPGILESELFGHTKGAFTNAIQDKKGLIEAAEGGTLFLDEIGNISAEMQNRLLRFLEDKKIRRVGSLQEKRIDCRVIAATNSDLSADIEAGNFRQDLYYRLRVVTLNVPPLRERRQDIPALANRFLKLHCKAYNLPPITIPEETMKWLQNYRWPGNVRELKNGLEGAAVLCINGHLEPQDLQLEETTVGGTRTIVDGPDQFSLESSEKDAIIRALRQTKGVQKSAAELLNISRRSIHYKLKKYDISPSDFK
ncbi:sigma-54 dependent transcriptional regulator [Desulfopila sp. IMCC35008]|uniref:sigma-54-dependent transcriptional regulator n=1 Tax=Desulfopila sp. IMCC35008 TaxID=2653858 RepID=UPI0013D7C41F|nr:sigma-54 dependent transcriptional regulator [Desulfopila sp. IMCC35008]